MQSGPPAGGPDCIDNAAPGAAMQMDHGIGGGACERDLYTANCRSILRPSGMAWSSGTLTVPQTRVLPSTSGGDTGLAQGTMPTAQRLSAPPSRSRGKAETSGSATRAATKARI